MALATSHNCGDGWLHFQLGSVSSQFLAEATLPLPSILGEYGIKTT
jgi:hypothetical protein